MTSALLADLVVLLHLAFVGFVVVGGLLVWRRPALAWLHVPAVLWAAWVELSGELCPLTPLENALRAAAGEHGYRGGFVDHYLVPLLYPRGLTREAQTALGLGVLALNGLVYARLLARRARDRG
jgi:hypothetical protein